MENSDPAVRTVPMILRISLVQACLIIGVAVFCALVANVVRNDPLSWTGGRDKAEQGESAFNAISIQEALAGYDKGLVRFIDAREKGDYASGHLPKAISIPSEDKDMPLERLSSADISGMTLVIYCSDKACTKAGHLAQRLQTLGIGNIMIMPEGWAGWYDAGFPVDEKGKQ